MLAFEVSPEMGKLVSNGEFATKVAEGPKGAGLLSARNGALPVAVGPWHRLALT